MSNIFLYLIFLALITCGNCEEISTEVPAEETLRQTSDSATEILDSTTSSSPVEVTAANAEAEVTTEAPPPEPTTEGEPKPYVNVKSEIFRKVILIDSYDKFVRPPGINGTGPAVVTVTMMLRNVENIDDEQMEYTTQLTFREQWADPRLKYRHLYDVDYIQLSTAGAIWVPDVFFSNEKEGKLHELMTSNFFGRIYPDGRVLVSYRITLTLSCPMNLHYYPMDKQNCYIKMTSYGWTTKDLVLKWPELSGGAAQIATFNMPRFKLTKHAMEDCASVTKTGAYSCIQLKLVFERQFGYYLIRIYAPCVMLVFVSWISFWLEPSATEARISLAITAVLTVVAQTDGINQSVPPTSYIKAVDVWTFMIQFMVFAAVLQFSYVNYLAKYHWQRMAARLNIVDEDGFTKSGCELRNQSEKMAKRVDNISKILFPVVFALFNIAYWSAYLGTHKS